MTRHWSALLSVLLASCNFDAAYSRYCENNPNCIKDAAPMLDRAPDGSGTSRPLRVRTCLTSAGCESGQFCSEGGVCVRISNCEVDTLDIAACGSSSAGCVRMFDRSAGVFRSVCACSDPGCRPNVCHPVDNICEPACNVPPDFYGCDRLGFVQRSCDPRFKWCVVAECQTNMDCTNPARPHCDYFNRSCGPCQGIGDCAGRPDGLTECASGACVRPHRSDAPG